jgi:hypothetical protein
MTCSRAGAGYGSATAWIALPGFGAGPVTAAPCAVREDQPNERTY